MSSCPTYFLSRLSVEVMDRNECSACRQPTRSRAGGSYAPHVHLGSLVLSSGE